MNAFGKQHPEKLHCVALWNYVVKSGRISSFRATAENDTLYDPSQAYGLSTLSLPHETPLVADGAIREMSGLRILTCLRRTYSSFMSLVSRCFSISRLSSYSWILYVQDTANSEVASPLLPPAPVSRFGYLGQS